MTLNQSFVNTQPYPAHQAALYKLKDVLPGTILKYFSAKIKIIKLICTFRNNVLIYRCNVEIEYLVMPIRVLIRMEFF
jgi:hypothetical protein